MPASRYLLMLKPAIWCMATFCALVLLAFLINAVGIWSLGGIHRWVNWFQEHRAYFLLWRLLVYGVTMCAWLPMRRRVLRSEGDAAAPGRLIRAEVAAIVVVVLIEAIPLFHRA
jgi:hypothetical protein